MLTLINVYVISTESNERLAELLNAKRIVIHSRKNEIKIQYVPPAINSTNSSIVWSALVEEYAGHSLG